ncbi:hypothetical protein Pan110_17820 [Gimesia panareensis]|nr:hypothetical protein Pan110_17820 [Gimesia panareensis]
MLKILFLLQLISTLYMVGLIWFVQVAHYPVFALVGKQEFVPFQLAHQLRTTLVVGPMMLIEAFSTIGLVYWRPSGFTAAEAWTGVGLLFVVWFSTALLQVPRHQRLIQGYDGRQIRLLVGTNWVRTLAWTGRGALLVGYLFRVLPGQAVG